jgi:hypothetical protein
MAITSNKARTALSDPSMIVFNREAGEAIVAGALVALDGTASGKAVNATDDADGYAVLGVAQQEVASGDRLDICTGIHGFTASGTIDGSSIGLSAYVVDNDTVGLAATTSNDVLVGEIVDVQSGQVFVKIAFGA